MILMFRMDDTGKEGELKELVLFKGYKGLNYRYVVIVVVSGGFIICVEWGILFFSWEFFFK